MQNNLNLGMLWFDNSDAQLKHKIERASSYYTRKYSGDPNVCYVNPAMLGELNPKRTITVGEHEVKLILDASIQPDHLWIGVVN